MKGLNNFVKMKWLKKRFKVYKYETGTGWLVFDTLLKRTYRSFLNEDDAKKTAIILNKQITNK